MGKKYQYFNGLKFTLDEMTGYYLNSTHKIRMHRYVWEYYNGEIPKGYCIHHIDHDKSNNDISNLMLMTIEEHSSLHGKEYSENYRDKMLNNLFYNVRPKATEWHKSDIGREWHKKHYQSMQSDLHIEREFTCEQCGKTFKSSQTRSRFCCNLCKSAYRRKSGDDDEERICRHCGKKFIVNKYSKTQYCSPECVGSSRKTVVYITKNCAVCGKEFTTRKDKEKDVCSIACSNKYRALKKKL